MVAEGFRRQQGVHIAKDPVSRRISLSDAIVSEGMAGEILRKVGLRKADYLLYPVAFARELPRGGKPQLFFAAVSLVPEPRLGAAALSAEQSCEYYWGDIVDADLGLEDYSQYRDRRFTYEGWACLNNSLKFIEANGATIRDAIEHAHSL